MTTDWAAKVHAAQRRLDTLRRKLDWAIAHGDHAGAILLGIRIRRELEDPR